VRAERRFGRRGALALIAFVTLLAPGAAGAQMGAQVGDRTGARPEEDAEGSLGLAGRSLAEALHRLQELGLRIVFTSETVHPGMVVAAEPATSDPRQALDRILAPFGLAIESGAGGTLIVVDAVAPAPPVDEGLGPESLPRIEEEMVVRPSRVSLIRREPVAPLGMTREEMLAVPHLGDDFYRALSLLPGVTSTDVTAQFHVRGGRRDETQILLDGQELFDAYHLKDYDSALSLIDSQTLGSADLTTGGYSARFGDRMSGVLDMTTVTPQGPAKGRVALSVLNASASGAGTFGPPGGGPEVGRPGEWLAEIRRGTIELVNELIGDEDPTYWDAYAKLRYPLGARNSLRLNLLGSGDELAFSEVEGEESSKRTSTEYGSRYGWLTHELLASDKLLLETAASWVETERDRRGVETDEDAAFAIQDIRSSRQLGLRQSWNLEASDRHFLTWGFEVRRWDTGYDYTAEKELDNPVPGGEEEDSVLFRESFEEDHDGLYLTDRIRLGEPLTLELGLRWDGYTQTDEDLVSPRVNLAWAVGDASVVRLAWGHFLQSQRPYELQVEDGETSFFPVEESEHVVVGFEHLFRLRAMDTLALRVEAYHREIDNPRPRYENLYEPLNTFPEAEPDRVRIAPERSESEGLEVFLRARHGHRIGWFVNYAWARIEDRIDGNWVPREYDQRHTVNVDFDYRLGKGWQVNLAWRFHTGLPITPLTLVPGEDDEGEPVFVPTLGELNSRRLSDYHRLDLRASRLWEMGGGRKLGVFVDIQNLTDRDNLAGYDVEIDDEEGLVHFEAEYWAGILPSIGVSFEF
jgi:hypothetical protein